MALEFDVLDIGQISYDDAWKIQQKLFIKRKEGTAPNTLILAEHPPTISLGTNEKWNKLHVTLEDLTREGIALVYSERGGGTTYLGPGQLVVYTIFDIAPFGTILNFMKGLEETMIRTAKDFEIPIERKVIMNPTTNKEYRAIWYSRQGKDYVFCTKGIKVSMIGASQFTHHGFIINVNKPSRNYFNMIDQCGFPSSYVTPVYMNEIVGRSIDMSDVKLKTINHLSDIFLNAKKGNKKTF